MSDQVKPNVPWDQPGQNDIPVADSEAVNNELADSDLIEVICPKCSQALALGREYLGGHCLCSTCDGLMRVSAEEIGGEKKIVVEIVEKETGKKMGDTAPTYAPDIGGAVIGEGTKPVKPLPKEYKGLAGRRATGNQPEAEKENVAQDGSDPRANLLQVPCPACGQVLALGREILGSHCLCSVCEELMLIGLQNVDGEGMKVVAEKVDKVTGEKITDVPSTSSPENGEASMEEDWENTRPVKAWTGSSGVEGGDEDDMDMGLTMPVPKMDTSGGDEDDMDMGLTMPVPKMDTGGGDEDDMDMGLTMPVPKMDEGGGDEDEMDLGNTMPIPGQADPAQKIEDDDDWKMTAPGQPSAPVAAKTPQASQTPSEPQSPTDGGSVPWEKSSTGRQGVKLAPPGRQQTGRVSGKAPSPTSGAVPTATTPPTKAPPPTTGSVPTLDAEQVAAKKAANAAASAGWKPPGATAIPPTAGAKAQKSPKKAGQAAEGSKSDSEKKKSDPFGNKPSTAAPKKKAVLKKRKKKGYGGLLAGAMVFLLLFVALVLFIVAPGIVPYGAEAREYIDGKIDEGMERLEESLAERAMNTDVPSGPPAGAVVNEGAGGSEAPGSGSDIKKASATPILTRERDAALQKVLSQEGEKVIRRFYGASTVDEKLAFVVDPDTARADMENYFAGKDDLSIVREVMFRGGARDMETGYYYGIFDVIENESPRRWCVVDPGTGLYQVDWFLYRQIVASELGSFLVTPADDGVKKSFHMLMKLGANVSSDDSPWFDETVSVDLQVPMISSNWYQVLMKKSVAESLGITTKLANNRLTIGVIEIAWVPGDKDPNKRHPTIVGIKRWGAWGRKEF